MFEIRKICYLAAIAALLFSPVHVRSQDGLSETEIGTCEECGTATETNVLNGSLQAISFKASMLQVATGEGTKVVAFDDDTIITGVKDLSAAKPGSNLAITYRKKGGALLAVSVEVAVAAPAELASNEIDTQTLVELLAAKGGELTLIDARSASSFEQEHIPGAISIYHADFDKKIDQLPADKNQLLVYYCNGTS